MDEVKEFKLTRVVAGFTVNLPHSIRSFEGNYRITCVVHDLHFSYHSRVTRAVDMPRHVT
jgi:hypothetical protein